MRKRGEVAKPKALLTLMESIGPTRTAKELHVSTTTLHKAKKNGEVTTTIELAARAILERMEHRRPREVPPPAPAPAAELPDDRPVRRLVILEVPEKSLEAMHRVAEYLGAKMLEE